MPNTPSSSRHRIRPQGVERNLDRSSSWATLLRDFDRERWLLLLSVLGIVVSVVIRGVEAVREGDLAVMTVATLASAVFALVLLGRALVLHSEALGQIREHTTLTAASKAMDSGTPWPTSFWDAFEDFPADFERPPQVPRSREPLDL